MDCAPTSLLDTPGFMHELNNRALAGRIPFSGGMDLTHRCNLRCVHCYLNCGREPGRDAGAGDLPTATVKRILSEVADAGCLVFLFTGGEPLVRADFPELYLHAKRLGLLVTLFTNGTLIDDSMAGLLADWPPQQVEITLYGVTAATHDAITGVAGSFLRVRQGIECLRRAGVPLGLKTMLMRANLDEFEGMRDHAGSIGAPFRMDPSLFPRLNGDRSPVGQRVPAEVAVEKELSISGRREAWRKYLAGLRPAVGPAELYDCAAGLSYFHITAAGRLQPCLMTTDVGYDLVSGRFAEGWAALSPDRWCEGLDGGSLACRTCADRGLCDSCPSFFYMENGSKLRYSEYQCEIARARKRILGDMV